MKTYLFVGRYSLLRVCVGLLALLLLAITPVFAQQDEGVPTSRLERLRAGGVGLGYWFWGFGTLDPAVAMANRVTATDMALIRGLGFQHVRLPVEISLIYDWENPGVLIPDYLERLDGALKMAFDHDLAVIISPFGDAYSDKMVDAEALDELFVFWQIYAEFLRQYDPNMLIIQIANEPVLEPAEWAVQQANLVNGMRQSLPGYTFITATPLVADGQWSIIDALSAMPTLDDKNVVYGFHFYEPVPFTHYKAEWIDWGDGVHPPSFDREWVRAKLAQAVAWAKEKNVPIVVDEFGVYHDTGNSQTERLAWLCIVVGTFRENQFGWTMWDYNGGFGMVENAGTHRIFDIAEVQALGLTPGGCPLDPDAPPLPPEEEALATPETGS